MGSVRGVVADYRLQRTSRSLKNAPAREARSHRGVMLDNFQPRGWSLQGRYMWCKFRVVGGGAVGGSP